jgi:hypothetical protein
MEACFGRSIRGAASFPPGDSGQPFEHANGIKTKGRQGRKKMIEAMLVVLSNPCPGRDDDFNDWYTNIHLRDALRFRGSIAAQRFKRSAIQVKVAGVEPDWQYLALYEAFNAALFTREHHDATLTPRMKISDAFDLSILNDYYYFPLQFRENDPENPHSGGVVLEQFNPVAEQEEIFRCWYRDEYFPQITARPGVRSGSFLMFRPHGQLLPTTPPHKYIAIYRIAEPSAAFAWQDNPVLSAASPMDPSTLRITCWDVLTQRVTEDDVHHTSAAALANEENARAHMGNRIITGG